jgi:hypothetical protein
MDASKLRNILIDLQPSEVDEINLKLTGLSSSLNSSIPSKISESIAEIKQLFDDDIINDYVPSNIKILKKIDALKFFGNTGFNTIEAILNENLYNISLTVDGLNKYISERKEFLELIKLTSDSLKKLNVEAHYSNISFEVGILMPKEVTYNKITTITKELNKWDKVIRTIKELDGQLVEDTEINFLNNGSLEFFIQSATEVAVCLSFIIDRVIKIYAKIVEIRNAKNKLKELGGLLPSEQKTIEKQEKEILNKEFDKIVQDLIKNYASKEIEKGRLNELKVAVKGHVIYIAKSIDNGMIIEINPPELAVPVESKETDSQEKKDEELKLKNNYDKTLKQINIVQEAMGSMKLIGNTGLELMKYLTEGEETKSSDADENLEDDSEENE